MLALLLLPIVCLSEARRLEFDAVTVRLAHQPVVAQIWIRTDRDSRFVVQFLPGRTEAETAGRVERIAQRLRQANECSPEWWKRLFVAPKNGCACILTHGWEPTPLMTVDRAMVLDMGVRPEKYAEAIIHRIQFAMDPAVLDYENFQQYEIAARDATISHQQLASRGATHKAGSDRRRPKEGMPESRRVYGSGFGFAAYEIELDSRPARALVALGLGSRRIMLLEIPTYAGRESPAERARSIAARMERLGSRDWLWWTRLRAVKRHGVVTLACGTEPEDYLLTCAPQTAAYWGLSPDQYADWTANHIRNQMQSILRPARSAFGAKPANPGQTERRRLESRP